MDFLKKIIGGKRYGYYVTLALTLLFLITALVYTVLFTGFKRDFSVFNSVILFVSFGVSLILIAINKTKYAHYVQGVLALASLVVFIDGIYLYASEVMTGIDFNAAEYSPFLVCAVLHVITYVVAMVNCFLPQVRKQELENEVEDNE